MSHEENLAWCAGFFDGEGYVGYQRSRPSLKSGKISPLLWACIPQHKNNSDVLEFFRSTIGFGKIYGPYTTKTGYSGKITTRYDLKYKTKEVMPLYEILKPFLRGNKIRDFERALTAYAEHDPDITLDDILRIEKNNKRRETRNV